MISGGACWLSAPPLMGCVGRSWTVRAVVREGAVVVLAKGRNRVGSWLVAGRLVRMVGKGERELGRDHNLLDLIIERAQAVRCRAERLGGNAGQGARGA